MNELNRLLQRSYREHALDLARNKDRNARRIPKPAGPQEIVYGDKVINIRNGSRPYYYPDHPMSLEYVANGEIGVVTGPFRGRGEALPLNRLEVEFSTQRGTAYKFWMNELGGDDGSSVLELAYAVTIHKSQGSEFGQTFVVLPNPCRVLSRELLYTALTRQRDHVTVLMQGDLADLRTYASAAYSETAARLTNLFNAPTPVEVDGRFLEAGLIHRTRKGIAVRSKSEVIIADLLFSKHIDFQYEQPLAMAGRQPALAGFHDRRRHNRNDDLLGAPRHAPATLLPAEMGGEARVVQEPRHSAAQRGRRPERHACYHRRRRRRLHLVGRHRGSRRYAARLSLGASSCAPLTLVTTPAEQITTRYASRWATGRLLRRQEPHRCRRSP